MDDMRGIFFIVFFAIVILVAALILNGITGMMEDYSNSVNSSLTLLK